MFQSHSRRHVLLSGLAVAGLSLPVGASQLFGAPDEFGGYVSTHIIVRLLPGVEPTALATGDVVIDGGPIDALRAQWNSTDVKPALAIAPRDRHLADKLGLSRTYLFVVPVGTDAPAMAQAFGVVPGVDFAEVDGVGGIAGGDPNDPDFDIQWALKNTGQSGGVVDADIGVIAAWEIFPGNASVTIAMLDTGIQETHADLTASGKFVPGWNTYDDNSVTDDPYGHGTHTAGIAAAVVNNLTGIAGINRYAKLMPMRVVSSQGLGTEAQCAAGVVWASDHGANIISASLQYYAGTQLFADAILYAYESGVLCVAASGNQAAAAVAYPGAFPGCMAVTATDRYDALYWASNTGPEVDLAAPGVEIWSTWKNGLYMLSTGTSMAAPMVSGVASLMWEYNPSLTVDQIAAILRTTAVDRGDTGFDELFGWGRLDAHAAVLESTLWGDMNCDGALNNFDIDSFVVAIVDATSYAMLYPGCNIVHGDMNRSGQVDNFDIDGFVSALLNQ